MKKTLNLVDGLLQEAILLHQQGQLSKAQSVYEKILQTQPRHFDALHYLGVIAYQTGNHLTAIELMGKAIQLNQTIPSVYSNYGNALAKLKQHEAALASYDKAIALKCDFAEAYSNRGDVLRELKHYEAALDNYNKAIALKPDYAEAYCNRGVALGDQKQYVEALENYHKALALKADISFLPGAYMYTKMQLCEWNNFSDHIYQLKTLIQQHKKALAPFELLSLMDSLPLQRQIAEIYAQTNYPVSHKLPKIPKYLKHQRIRIGYFSADFKEHPLAFLTAELYELHRRDRFEIIAFSFAPTNNSAIRKRLEAGFDHFIDASTMSDEDVALLSRKMEIDIAVDLGGFTKDARSGIFPMGAAPIQVNYLGYPGTMGASYVDYIIADKMLIPPQSEQHYSEKVVYLPDTYQVNDSQLPISDKVFSRQELGLPEQGFVFCCFNNNYKITPNTFDGWMRILKRVKGSVLWLFEDNPFAASNLKKEAEIRGVSKDRLIFAQRMKSSEHLARHRIADLFLDTLPYNAHTTASDSLRVGLPVLTCIGESFASRVAASLLTAIGLPELITTSQDDYEEFAVKLATHPDLLITLKQKLQANRLTTPLFDTQLFTQHIENAYRQMYDRYQADLPPEPIYVEAENLMKLLLHVGCSHNRIDRTSHGFNNGRWKELRLDIDGAVNPDIVGTMTDMSGVQDSLVDAIFSSHNIEHLYPHEVHVALKEFYRVLKVDGFCVITCPDLKSVCAWVAQDKLTEPAYVSPSGPITPLDMLYGHRGFLAKGNLYMAHRCGFTEKVLRATLNAGGFQSIASLTRPQAFDCWAIACKNKRSDDELRKLAKDHFPT